MTFVAADLPRTLQDLSEVIGLPAVETLVRQWGGRRLWIPCGAKKTHPISQALGMNAAKRLSARYGGDVIDIPKAKSATARDRNQELIRLYSDGVSVDVLAKEFGLTSRWIRGILSRSPTREYNHPANPFRARVK